MNVPEPLRLAYRECAQIVRQTARNFYYAFFALPKRERASLNALYAFCRLVDDAADEPGPVEKKHVRLDQYRRQFELAAAGEAQTPVFTALGDTVRRYEIPHHLFHQLIDGMKQDLTVTRYADFESMKEYCYLVASTVGLMCLPVFGCTDEKAREYGIDLGIALQITNILRDIAEDAERDRIYIPQEDLIAHGYSEDELRQGVVNDAFRSLIKVQIERARGYYESASALFQYLPERTRACPMIMYRVYERILDMIEAADYDVFSRRIGPSKYEKLRMVGQVWKQSVFSHV